MNAVRTITTEELAAALRGAGVDQFWNVLTADYFGGELIPGSRWVPVDTVGREVNTSQLDKDSRIVVYCSGLSCPMSRDAAGKLATLGFTNVLLFEGGLEAWTQSGRGVEILRRATAA
ncbi:MAG TPA: rhodanese-like domain-containing protein [Gemmatimonadaceae bacterium]